LVSVFLLPPQAAKGNKTPPALIIDSSRIRIAQMGVFFSSSAHSDERKMIDNATDVEILQVPLKT